MRLESTWNTTFSVVPAEKFPERSNGTFQKVVLERPKKLFQTCSISSKPSLIFFWYQFPGSARGGNGIPVYPKKIRQNTPNSGSEINFLIWAPTGEQV